MDDETRQLIEGVEQRTAKASLGPWIAVRPRDQDGGASICHTGPTWGDDFPARSSVRVAVGPMRIYDWLQHEANADFIAHARTDLPLLCVKVREQDVSISRLCVLLNRGARIISDAIEADWQSQWDDYHGLTAQGVYEDYGPDFLKDVRAELSRAGVTAESPDTARLRSALGLVGGTVDDLVAEICRLQELASQHVAATLGANGK
jgi:hypothetical protein